MSAGCTTANDGSERGRGRRRRRNEREPRAPHHPRRRQMEGKTADALRVEGSVGYPKTAARGLAGSQDRGVRGWKEGREMDHTGDRGEGERAQPTVRELG